MQILKVALIAAGGLGVTWAASQVTGSLLGLDADRVRVAQADGGAKPDQGQAAGKTEIEQLSDEEIARELERIEAASGAANPDELEEFKPSRPLAADLAIALPSDI